MKKILLFMLVLLLVVFCVFAVMLSSEGGKDFFYRYRTEIFEITGTVLVLAFSAAARVLGSKENKRLDESLEATREPVFGAVNDMIDGYNAMTKDYDKHAVIEEARDRAIAVVMAQNTFIIETLQTVYANSKNLPQGVKDIVNLKYAKCLKAIGDDETLKRLSELFRDELAKVTQGDSDNETEA